MIIAIDGPAGAGKGTIAKLLAEKLEFAYLDTGLLYRAVGYKWMQQHGIEAATIAVSLTSEDMHIAALRTPAVAEAASIVAAIPAVRDALIMFQRQFAHHPPLGKKGAVLDGRDIGTVICPDATHKFFLTATPEIRAERRFKELQALGDTTPFATILTAVKERDERDSTRATAPLKPAIDAVVIDTSSKNIEAVLAAVVEKVLENL
jgi:cytidylate kinase